MLSSFLPIQAKSSSKEKVGSVLSADGATAPYYVLMDQPPCSVLCADGPTTPTGDRGIVHSLGGLDRKFSLPGDV